MKLKDLLAGIEVLASTADPETEVPGVCYDSRKAGPGELFVAVTGYAVDGHAYIGKAKAAGAAAVLCERVPEEDIPYIRVRDSRRALAILGGNFYRHPAREMTMVAVTGTNGKTTTTYLLKAILEGRGAKVGLIGTNQNMIGGEIVPTERTTPESLELQALLRRMADAGCTHVVMETSSHALFEDRVYGIHYAVGIFTNLTQDHLDFHKTMEAYCDAKAILFRHCDRGVFNADDPWTERLWQDATCTRFTYAEKAGLDPENMLSCISGGAAGSWQLSNMIPRVLKDDLNPGFFIKHQVKDLRIAREEAAGSGAQLPVLELVAAMYEQLLSEGDGELGTQALIKAYREG